jgi:hypothetical protein
MQALKYGYRLIDQEAGLKLAVESLHASTAVALDIEAYCTPNVEQRHLGQVSLIQLCSHVEPVVFLVDVCKLGPATVEKHLRSVLVEEKIQKLMFDCRRDVEALSSQLQLVPKGIMDLQLLQTAVQWKTRGVNRRSGMGFVLKQSCQLVRQEGNSAVTAAMTLGNRPVWDVRPLPDHFLEYAADDVRHILVMAEPLLRDNAALLPAVDRLTQHYVEHYGTGVVPLEKEADPQPSVVDAAWLERYLGPCGVCAFCGQKGHQEAECFKKASAPRRCSHCGEEGHIATKCYKKHPNLFKCSHCGQTGHNASRCFAKDPCKHCGGQHASSSCRTVKNTDMKDTATGGK